MRLDQVAPEPIPEDGAFFKERVGDERGVARESGGDDHRAITRGRLRKRPGDVFACRVGWQAPAAIDLLRVIGVPPDFGVRSFPGEEDRAENPRRPQPAEDLGHAPGEVGHEGRGGRRKRLNARSGQHRPPEPAPRLARRPHPQVRGERGEVREREGEIDQSGILGDQPCQKPEQLWIRGETAPVRASRADRDTDRNVLRDDGIEEGKEPGSRGRRRHAVDEQNAGKRAGRLSRLPSGRDRHRTAQDGVRKKGPAIHGFLGLLPVHLCSLDRCDRDHNGRAAFWVRRNCRFAEAGPVPRCRKTERRR